MMQLFKIFASWIKTPWGMTVVLIMSMVVVIGIFAYRMENFKKARDEALREVAHWQIQASFNSSIRDTVWIRGEYKIDTTAIIKKIYVGKDHPDTIEIPCPVYSGSIGIDTTKYFGEKSNLFGVRVSGRYFWPKDRAKNNWTVIDVLGYKNGWVGPDDADDKTRREFGFACGMAALSGPNSELNMLGYIRIKRLSVYAGMNAPNRSWSLGLGVDLLKF